MNIILKQHDNNQRNVLHKGGIIIKRKEIQFMALGGGLGFVVSFMTIRKHLRV